jgi:hypothetical protein
MANANMVKPRRDTMQCRAQERGRISGEQMNIDLKKRRRHSTCFLGINRGGNFSEFFPRQALGNPIKRQPMGPRRDKGVAARVQNILKKVKKNLVTGLNLH